MLPVYEIRKTDLTVKHNNYELTYPEHIHKYIEIVYVYKGSQHIRIENSEYALTAGCAAAVFPDTVHSFYSLDKKESEVLILMADPKIFGSLFPDLGHMTPETPFITAVNMPRELKCAFDMISPNQPFDRSFSWTCVIMSYLLDTLRLKSHESQPVKDITYKMLK